MIGGFRSDMSITRKIDGNLETFLQEFCFPKSRINENGGNALLVEGPLNGFAALFC